MSLLEHITSFVHIPTQRTGYVKDGPFHEFDKSGVKLPGERWPIVFTEYVVVWDDTGKVDMVRADEITFIPMHKRHITDGKRVCHCGPSEIDGVVVHRGSEELN